MCDVRLFKSAYMDFQAARTIYQTPYNDEMFLNNAAYHLKQYGANLVITEWLDEHSEMLSTWEAESRYNMDFLVEKRKLISFLPENKRKCSEFDLNCYYIMFAKRLNMETTEKEVRKDESVESVGCI